MGLFRRRSETLNEILMREAGLDASGSEVGEASPPPQPRPPAPASPPPVDPSPYAPPPPRVETPRWDVLTTVDAPGIGGSEVTFVALPDASLLVESEQGDADLSPFADAIERQIEAPYRAHGVRATESRWNISAIKLTVIEMATEGDRIDVTAYQGKTTATVDERPVDERFPAVEAVASAHGPDYAARAERLDGDLWEVRAEPL